MQHQNRKCHQGRKCNINVYRSVQRKITKRTKYRGDEINPRQLIHYLKIEIVALNENHSKAAGINSETDGAP